jgi:hypothetical protein
LSKRLGKGKGKYEGKPPFKNFSCGKIAHYASRCLESVFKYKPKYEKKCYYVTNEGVIDEEWVFIAIKEDDPKTPNSTSSINVEKSLNTQIEYKDEWVIDNRCSHHTTGEKSKFVSMERYACGIVRFCDNKAGIIHGRSTFILMVNTILMMYYMWKA